MDTLLPTQSNLAGIIIDCNSENLPLSGDLTQAAQFWSQALGYPIKPSTESIDTNYIHLDTGPNGLHIEVQSVEHPSRVHIDLAAEDVEAEVLRLEALGATRHNKVHDWWVMEAPTGHRFCVLPKRVAKATNGALSICPVNAENWRAVANVEVSPEQRLFVQPPAYYLSLCHYSNAGWKPLAIIVNEVVMGMMMWAVGPDDGYCWFVGIQIDHQQQRSGYGRKAIQLAISMFNQKFGYQHFALSYQPSNSAKALYRELGFVEQDEWEDDEVVARLVV